MADDEDWGAGDFGDDDDAGWGDDAGGGDDDDAWGDMVEDDDPLAAMVSAEDEEKEKKFDLSRYTFGDAAFAKMKKREAPMKNTRDLCSQIPSILAASVKNVASMRGQRGQLSVTQMVQNIYRSGLFTLGSASSPVNSEVVPACRYIIDFCSELPPKDPKRVSVLTTLARACEDCQQVQAREVLRLFGDLTNQNQTFEDQVQFFLLRQKEEALNSFITQSHQNCDLDHTKIKPWQQRAHLTSAYLNMLGDQFGLQGVEAAKGDRFLDQTTQELQNGLWAGVSTATVLLLLKKHLAVDQFVDYLLADINNQSPNADRLIDRSVIFKWVQKHLSNDEARKVFYDEERADEYKDQDPKAPTKANQFEPFLSKKFLVRILMQMGFLSYGKKK